MPILTLQRQFRELGRIRMGQQVPLGGGRQGSRPEKLETFRLTSPSRELLDHAAVEYRGTVVPWAGALDGDEWELVTEVKSLDIIVPPGRSLSQWNEMWGAGGCLRRCDGDREWLSGGPCLCPADPVDRNELASKGQACKPTTRLQVILPRLPDLGTWLLVSHGYYAAVELAGTADLLMAAAQGGTMIPARLRIDQRSVKRPGQPPKHFAVPIIEILGTMTDLISGAGMAVPALTRGNGHPTLPEGAPLPADASFTMPVSAATPAEALAKTPQEAAADVAAKRAARVAAVPAEPEGLFPAADDGLVAAAMALAAEQRAWKEGDVHTPGHKGLIRNERGFFCPTKLTDGKWCQFTERS